MARLLIDRGYTHVRPLAGGLDGWVDAGLPVERIAFDAVEESTAAG